MNLLARGTRIEVRPTVHGIEFLRWRRYYFRETSVMLRRSLTFVLLFFAVAATPCLSQDTWHREADHLATLLQWHSDSVVAEVGAGNGELSALAADRVGPSGKVYTTELDTGKLSHLKELASQHANVTVIQAGDTSTNLPPACCDSIFMRLVYHHLTKPAEIDASLFQSLKPGGRLAVIDEIPSKGSTVPEGVPANRGGHGIPQQILISELTGAGFKVETVQNDWPPGDAYHQLYCVVFVKPDNSK
ncbi:MAG TPA: class I SAM-dependent methyltransferase [Verrucomicrobiae bacterium]|nr:class I SAM-dependent methyltransferase [Verrucomicrobiae bacterium]